MRVLQGVVPAPGRVAAAALGAAAQAALVGVQRAALARLTGPLAAGGILEDLQGPGGSCKEKSTFLLEMNRFHNVRVSRPKLYDFKILSSHFSYQPSWDLDKKTPSYCKYGNLLLI